MLAPRVAAVCSWVVFLSLGCVLSAAFVSRFRTHDKTGAVEPLKGVPLTVDGFEWLGMIGPAVRVGQGSSRIFIFYFLFFVETEHGTAEAYPTGLKIVIDIRLLIE